MANKLYEEESVRKIAEAIRVKLATPNGEKASEGDEYLISDMAKAVENIPIRLGFPSTSRTDITSQLTTSKKWSATGNGWVYYDAGGRSSTSSWRTVVLFNETKNIKSVNSHYRYDIVHYYRQRAEWSNCGWQYQYSPNTNPEIDLLLPVSKGDVISYYLGGTSSSTVKIYFISESEASLRSKLKP